MYNNLLLAIALCFSFFTLSAQYSIKGEVIDSKNNALSGVNVLLSGSEIGVNTDSEGKFTINIPANDPGTLVLTYIGQREELIPVSKNMTGPISVVMSVSNFFIGETVVSAKRKESKLVESPVSIQKFNEEQIKSTSGIDIYKELDQLKDVHVIDNSFGFKIVNTRGFNTTSSFRLVQFLDGMDNQSVGLNFSPGNLFGASDLDLKSVEMLSGPASALYGPNALQGVLSLETKNPFDEQGVAFQVKAGNRKFVQTDIWAGDVFGKNEQFAFKISGSIFKAQDWEAVDPVANGYRPISSPPINLAGISAGLGAVSPLFQDFNNYLAANPSVNPNDIPPGTQFILPAYQETDILDNKTHSAKLSTGMYYRLKKTEFSYLFRFANASGVYQGNNRAKFDNFDFYQNRVQIKHDNFLFKYYNNIDYTLDSYDLVLTGINTGFAGLGGYAQSYLGAYVQSIADQTNNFADAPGANTREAAVSAALAASENVWIQPGTAQFEAVTDAVKANPNRPTGSGYISKSKLHHLEGLFTKDFDFIDFTVGASFRRFNPITDGTLFVDTLLADGSNYDISFNEYAAYTQLSKKFFNDKLELLASFRFDKSQNFNAQFSPRGAIVYTTNSHSFRVIGQSAFRSPTLNDQFFFLNVGPFIVRGNIDGFENVYTESSVSNYLASGPPGMGDESWLELITIDPVQPEKLNSVEFGYRGIVKDKLSVDFNAYFNLYKNFIGSIRAVETKSGEGGTAAGETDLITRNSQTYSIAANATDNVKSYGLGVAAIYAFSKTINANANYSYNKFLDQDSDDPLIPGYNTPLHKVNVGITGNKVWKGLGFGVNWKWVDFYDWEATFASGRVPAYNTMDLQVNYKIEKLGTTLKFGSSNVYNNEHIEAYGAGLIGGFYYGSILFEAKKPKNK
jgi:iron complex outermembrane receptor protein